MSFETFNPSQSRRHKGIEKRVTISKSGQITLNVACARSHFVDVSYVNLLFDREQRRIAIKPTTADDSNACKLATSKAGSASLSGRGFLSFCDVPYEQTTAYPAAWDESLGAIVVALDD